MNFLCRFTMKASHASQPKKFLREKLKKQAVLPALFFFGLLASGNIILAQQNDSIESIFVTAERRAYQGNFDSLENPTSVQMIDSQLLKEAGVLNLNDALDLSASVARQNNFGGLWNSFSVRGFSGDINLPSGFLVNGFNAGKGFGGPRDIVGIDSVEILKGPRSALFGRGEPGGSINLLTKRPEFRVSGDFKASFGKWNQTRLEADYQTVVGESENIGIRLVGFTEDSESFRDTIETQKVGFYPSIALSLSEQTKLTYELEFTEQEIPFDRGVAYSEKFGFSPQSTFSGEPGDGPIDTKVLGHQLELQHNFNETWSLLAGLGYRDTEFKGSASEPNFGGRQSYFNDGKTLSRFYRFRDYESEYSVVRAEVAGEFSSGSLRHRLIFGSDYDQFENNQLVLRYRPGWFGPNGDVSALDPAKYLLLDVFNPVYGQHPQPTPGPNTDRKEKLGGLGIYFQDQIDITEKFQIRFGMRWDDFDQDLTNLRSTPAKTVSTSDSRISPQFGAVYLVNDDLSVYASYGEGFRQQSGSDFKGNQLDSNLTESSEIGFKFEGFMFDSIPSSLSMAFFKVNQSNILVNDNRPEAQAVGWFSASAGEAESTGLEIDAVLETGSGLNLWFSYAYTDAEFTNSNPDTDFGAQIDAGDQMINSPKNQANIQVSKLLPLGGLEAQLGAGAVYTGERVGWTAYDFYLPSYTSARLFGQVELSDSWTVRVDVDNVFDEEFYTNSYADVWVEPGAPTRWRFSASYSF